MRIPGTATAAAQFPGFSKWGFACGHIGNATLQILYVCDASVFLNCTDKTTTISILAFSLHTSEHLIENFRSGEHKAA